MPKCKCGYLMKGNDCFACNNQLPVVHKEVKIKIATTDRAADIREYNKRIKVYLANHPRCAVFPELKSNQVHHIAGRIGKKLLDQKYWLAVSDAGHTKIHNFPVWASENGFRILRSTNVEK